MPIVTNNVWQEGDVPTATELNQPYDGVAAANITPDNTKDNWVTYHHFKSGT